MFEENRPPYVPTRKPATGFRGLLLDTLTAFLIIWMAVAYGAVLLKIPPDKLERGQIIFAALLIGLAAFVWGCYRFRKPDDR